MPYEPLSIAEFLALKPQFADLPPEQLQVFIDMASRFVDESWLESDYHLAWASMVCHLLTMEGLGGSTEAEVILAGGSRVSSIKSGTLSISYNQKDEAPGEHELWAWLGESACGRFYRLLMRLNRGGPRLLTAWGTACQSGYAKDWPWIGRGG